tara:strand:- start:181 stop:495 length:315 start_codon:yes stop_codon:yes gene_type:complete
MQLYLIDWSFQNNEDQLFATNEFCQYLNEGKLYENIEGFKLEYIAHTPQNGSGIIICKTTEISILFKVFNMWRKNFNVSFNFKPALTSEELASLQNEESFWERG